MGSAAPASPTLTTVAVVPDAVVTSNRASQTSIAALTIEAAPAQCGRLATAAFTSRVAMFACTSFACTSTPDVLSVHIGRTATATGLMAALVTPSVITGWPG